MAFRDLVGSPLVINHPACRKMFIGVVMSSYGEGPPFCDEGIGLGNMLRWYYDAAGGRALRGLAQQIAEEPVLPPRFLSTNLLETWFR